MREESLRALFASSSQHTAYLRIREKKNKTEGEGEEKEKERCKRPSIIVNT